MVTSKWVTGIGNLKRLLETQQKSGNSLATLGFGMGNYNDTPMNKLAEIGDGNATYIDRALEARKVLVLKGNPPALLGRPS